MTAPRHICSQVNLTMCKTLGIEPTAYDAFDTVYLSLQIHSPYTLALLIITVLCALRMIAHVDSLYSSIGRGEMKTFFYLYITSNLLLMLSLCFEKTFDESFLKGMNILQVSLQSTMFFSLLAGGLTIDKIYGIMGMKSANFMRSLSLGYFTLVFTFVYIFASIKHKELITILMVIDAASVVMYIMIQGNKLKKNNGEIWGFGVLGVTFMFFVMSMVHTCVAASIVASFSERNIDNMFFVIMYTFLVVMMSHKFWLSTCDFERECLTLTI